MPRLARRVKLTRGKIRKFIKCPTFKLLQAVFSGSYDGCSVPCVTAQHVVFKAIDGPCRGCPMNLPTCSGQKKQHDDASMVHASREYNWQKGGGRR